MAVEWKIDGKVPRNSEYLLYPEQITIRPEDSGRFEAANFAGILHSFEQIGQLEPVSIYSEGGSPVLISGFNRWMAAKKFNEGKPEALRMRLRCVLNKGDALKRATMNIHENIYRNPTTELDDAHNIAKLRGYGKTTEEIADTYQQSTAWVKKREKLLDLTDEAQRALIRGDLKITAAARLARMSAEEQHAAITGGGKTKQKPARPGRKAQLEAIQLVADSPAYSQPVRAFAAKFALFLAGEIGATEL